MNEKPSIIPSPPRIANINQVIKIEDFILRRKKMKWCEVTFSKIIHLKIVPKVYMLHDQHFI